MSPMSAFIAPTRAAMVRSSHVQPGLGMRAGLDFRVQKHSVTFPKWEVCKAHAKVLVSGNSEDSVPGQPDFHLYSFGYISQLPCSHRPC